MSHRNALVCFHCRQIVADACDPPLCDVQPMVPAAALEDALDYWYDFPTDLDAAGAWRKAYERGRRVLEGPSA